MRSRDASGRTRDSELILKEEQESVRQRAERRRQASLGVEVAEQEQRHQGETHCPESGVRQTGRSDEAAGTGRVPLGGSPGPQT